MQRSVTFPASLEQLPAILQWIEECTNTLRFTAAEMRKIHLVMEEAIVNVIRHAYQDKIGSIDLYCHIIEGKVLQFILKDKGFPFNPLALKQEPLMEKVEGGLGILLMKEYMDEILYERCHPYNRLTLIKRICSN